MSWLTRLLGKDGTSQAAIRATSGALAVENKPIHQTLGSYQLSVVTGTLAAALAASAVVFSARWSDAAKIALIHSLRWRFLPLTAFTAATLTDHTSFDAFIGTAFTASHTGGTGITLGGTALKLRQSMAGSAFTDLRIATTAALAGAAGLTLAAHPFAQSIRKGNRVNPAAATEEVIQPQTDGNDTAFEPGNTGLHPIVLAQNEGIVIRNRTVWPAAGTGILLVEMGWTELATSADYP
jgi:hypothetical protein